jgi:hypothetical protein
MRPNSIHSVAAKIYISAIIVSAMLFMPAGVRAKTIDFHSHYETTLSGNLISYGTYIPFPLFSSSLGTLNEITLNEHLYYEFTAQWDASRNVDYSHLIYLSVDDSEFGLSFDGIFQQQTPPHLEIQVNPGDVGSFDSGEMIVFDQTISTTNVPDLIDYVGNGNFLAALSGESSGYFGECFARIGECTRGSAQTRTRYEWTLTYEYRPFGVPEPATWSALVLGFTICAQLLRRRQQRSPSPTLTPRLSPL